MSNADEETPEIIIDEDWKTRVQTEREQLRACVGTHCVRQAPVATGRSCDSASQFPAVGSNARQSSDDGVTAGDRGQDGRRHSGGG